MPVSKTKTKTNDVCQVRCFNTELVTQLRENLPSEEILEEMTVIFGALADRIARGLKYFTLLEMVMSFVFAILQPC